MLKSIRKIIIQMDQNVFGGNLWLIRRSLFRYMHIKKMAKSPIFVGGCGRSGTTLLLSLLSVHPNIAAIPRETSRFTSMKKKVINDKKVKVPEEKVCFDIRGFYSNLWKVEDLESASRWVEKTPRNIHFVEELINYFGSETRIIHIVRDGRDVVTSKHPRDPGKYHVYPERWVIDVSAGMKAEKYDQVITVRYENLVSNWKESMKKVFSFLGEEYPESINKYPRSASVTSSNAWRNGAREIDDKSVGRWKKEEHKEVVDKLISIPRAMDLLRHYGYV